MSSKKIAGLGILSALSIVLASVIHFPLFAIAPFLEYDPADIPIFITTFMYGPLTGLIITIFVSLIQGFTVSAQSGVYGIIMHVIATGTFVIVAGNIYKHKKTLKMAIVSLLCGILAWVLIMIPANFLITPYFTGAPISFVKKIMLPGIIPFNIIKSSVNAFITFILYKSIHKIFKKFVDKPTIDLTNIAPYSNESDSETKDKKDDNLNNN